MRARQTLAIVLAAVAPRLAAGADFATVASILEARCVVCHSGPNAPLSLRLDSLEGVRAGSSRGPVATPGDPEGSELVHRIRGSRSPRMPMTGPPFLSAEEIASIERWIAAGMPAGSGGASEFKAAAPPRPGPGEPVTYAHVAPILATRCAKCHTERGLMGPAPEGLQLTSYAATLSATERARVVPGMPDASELVRRIRGQSLPRMPFDGPPFLDPEEISLISEWVRQGARDSAGTAAPLPVGARVRFEGTLSGEWRLDGLELDVPAGARIDKRPRSGDRVEVRGRVGADGRISVERLRRR